MAEHTIDTVSTALSIVLPELVMSRGCQTDNVALLPLYSMSSSQEHECRCLIQEYNHPLGVVSPFFFGSKSPQ